MERDFEKDMMELDVAIKSNAERDNTFTLSVLQRAKAIMVHQKEKLKAYEDTGLTPEEIMDGKTLTGWIPVAEQLPNERDGHVIVCCEGGEVNIGMHSEFSGNWYIGEMCGIGGPSVIAWMPLPKPYKPEK